MQLPSAAFAFQINGTPVSCREFGQGHINQTLRMQTDTGHEYILQRISQYVFREPERLMENACAITDFLRAKDPDPRHTLHFMTTPAGQCFHYDEQGEFWRMYEFVGGLSLDAPETELDLYQSGLAFGNFQKLLSDFPAHTLHETIPNFHNTVDRYRLLRESAAADVCGRLAGVQEEMDFLMAHEELACTLQRMREADLLPLRVTHNDTKINNVLFDEETLAPLVVIDLDTVMPGLIGHDFGDAIRFAANFVAEDCPNSEQAGLNLNVFWAFAEGFLQKTAKDLTENEINTLALSCFVLACELSTRFLDDYILGDKYFKIKSPKHNLERTRCQIVLAKDMLKKMDAMNAIVKDCCERFR